MIGIFQEIGGLAGSCLYKLKRLQFNMVFPLFFYYRILPTIHLHKYCKYKRDEVVRERDVQCSCNDMNIVCQDKYYIFSHQKLVFCMLDFVYYIEYSQQLFFEKNFMLKNQQKYKISSILSSQKTIIYLYISLSHIS